VTVGLCPTIAESLASGRFDLGLMLQSRAGAPVGTAGEPVPPVGPADVLDLTDVPLVVFCRAEHPLASLTSRPPVPRAWLAPYTVFVTDARGHPVDYCPGKAVRDSFVADGLPGPRLEPTGSVEAVKRNVVADQLALGVLPAYALAEELRTGVVHALSLWPAVPPLRLVAMPCHRLSPMRPVVAELIEVLSTTPGQRPARPNAGRIGRNAP
jgi:DNA-binding transcriptional LysR family regulator